LADRGVMVTAVEGMTGLNGFTESPVLRMTRI
jgi:hypothetical protein